MNFRPKQPPPRGGDCSLALARQGKCALLLQLFHAAMEFIHGFFVAVHGVFDVAFSPAQNGEGGETVHGKENNRNNADQDEEGGVLK
jgi:hypothetical protein